MKLSNLSLSYLTNGYAVLALKKLHDAGYTRVTKNMIYMVAQNRKSFYSKEIQQVLMGIIVNNYQAKNSHKNNTVVKKDFTPCFYRKIDTTKTAHERAK